MSDTARKIDPEAAPLSWYYPISPRLALLLTEVDEEPSFSRAGLTSAQVNSPNARMVEASHSQVFAQSRVSLETYAKGGPREERPSE
jgi:hypothetical protein